LKQGRNKFWRKVDTRETKEEKDEKKEIFSAEEDYLYGAGIVGGTIDGGIR
jgi:hypothetical protein